MSALAYISCWQQQSGYHQEATLEFRSREYIGHLLTAAERSKNEPFEVK